ncbi:MAG: LD-carboxypeptidase, partial [Chitinophagaceae bacterium]
MQRNSFLATVGALLAGSFLPKTASALLPEGEEAGPVRLPPYLKPGDTIALTSPAGAITEAEL